MLIIYMPRNINIIYPHVLHPTFLFYTILFSPTSNSFSFFSCLFTSLISFAHLKQVRGKIPKMLRTTFASCTSNRHSTGTKGRSGRLFTRTSPAPLTPTTSAGFSATSRIQC